MNSEVNQPLSSIRALELSEIWAGPFCGSLLGDMGAEVIKIESIQRIGRGPINPPANAGGYPDDDPGKEPWNRQSNFNAINRNKKSLTLDLKTQPGLNSFKDLVSQSDVVFCNYARTVMENFGLSYEQVRKIKPDIIYMLMPGYGNDGPYANYRSMGMAIDAITGHSYLRGYPDMDQSSNSLVHHPDAVSATNGVMALTSALVYRAKTGKGQFIDMSQAESFMTHLGEIYLENQMTSSIRKRRGNRHPDFAPQGVYKCSGDDNWIAISIKTDKEWHQLKAIIGDNSLEDTDLDSLEARLQNHDHLDARINEWASTRDRYDALTLLQAAGITSGVVIDCGADSYADPHLNERDFFQIVDHPAAGLYPMTGPIFKFKSDQGRITHNPAPCLGQDNEHILEELLGYSKNTINKFKTDEIIGTVPLPGSDMGGSRRVAKQRKENSKD